MENREQRHSLLWFLVALFVTFSFEAQELKGLVINELEQPLEAVYIYNLNSLNHTHSSENGVFALDKTQIGDSLRIGLLGYKAKTIVVDDTYKTKDVTVVLEEKAFQLEEMVLTEQLNTVSTITRLDLNTTPVNSSQDILRKVPGLITGQHAGGGKAEQLFLRGFDIDHGTDLAITVDGMPVNMLSHAHGQGYSDLHFVIPETVNKIDFGKGTYYGDKGDFNTAAYVDFSTRDYLVENTVSVGFGDFNTQRTLGMFKLLDNAKNKNAYMAVEYLASDGPFESPQNFNRFNIFGKYTTFTPENNKFSLTASHFTSRWDASGQIPQREVDNGNITRFGAIDDTEGGRTSRTNFNAAYIQNLEDNSIITTNAFYTRYDFELYSNFTFFLNDPVNGDQIRQREGRDILGLNTSIRKDSYLGSIPFNYTSGLGIRHDIIDNVELSRTANRNTTLSNVQFGDVNQTNIYGFFNTEFEFGKLKVAPALRVDHFKFIYKDELQDTYSLQSQSKSIISPKLNFYYDVEDNMQLFLKSGIGFHSNDARVVVQQTRDILPKAYGTDLGLVWKPVPKLVFNSALWYLFLEQEFVYVGDEGIVEPSGKTERFGLDLGMRYQINDWLYLDTDATVTRARSLEAPSGEDYIPLAPDVTLTGGLSVTDLGRFSGGLRTRYLSDRPANEDNSIVAEGYVVTDFNINYKMGDVTLGLVVENLFDVAWNETQFATESRLQNESQSVEEIHFTPGVPFFVRASVRYTF
ncbi:MAG: TonB-dependent receptor [Bacteroidia bacterium]|nr:TonB-dependent receptor [Bacteroidia bacterium]